MLQDKDSVTVTIMGREIAIKCKPHEKDALGRAALLLDSKMRDLKTSGKLVSYDTIAIMAGLNLANEILNNHKTSQNHTKAQQRLRQLNNRLKSAVKSELKETIDA